MIYVKTLREILAKLPDDGEARVYEGEESGITIRTKESEGYWINTGYSDEEENQDDDIIELLGKG